MNRFHFWSGLVAAITFLAMGSATSFAQTSADKIAGDEASRRDSGSATTLIGSTCIYHLYVTDIATNWRQHDLDLIDAHMRDATSFLTEQSRLAGHEITFIQVRGREVFFDPGVPTDMFADPKWTERVIQAAGFRSGRELVSMLKEHLQVDHAFVAIHVNKAACCYNLAYYNRVDPVYYAERMVCFTRYPDGRPTSTATYAHEILHVFGAGDLYFPYDEEASRRQLAEQNFPNDIMLRVDYDISKLDVGTFTSYRVGWLAELSEKFRVFED